MKLVTWWWNCKADLHERRDIRIFTDGQGDYEVVAQTGGAEGDLRKWYCMTAKTAANLVLDLKDEQPKWRRLVEEEPTAEELLEFFLDRIDESVLEEQAKQRFTDEVLDISRGSDGSL